MRVSYIGITLAFQANERGSTPLTCSLLIFNKKILDMTLIMSCFIFMITPKKTKIIATIGPSCEQEKTIEKLIFLGVDGARLNFSHGSHQEHGNRIKLIRKIAKKLNRQVAIIADIQGPKIRIGNVPALGIELKNGQEITIDSGTREFYENRIPLPSLLFREGTKEGHIVFIDDGTLQIKIISKRAGIFKAIVLKGGILFSKKGII